MGTSPAHSVIPLSLEQCRRQLLQKLRDGVPEGPCLLPPSHMQWILWIESEMEHFLNSSASTSELSQAQSTEVLPDLPWLYGVYFAFVDLIMGSAPQLSPTVSQIVEELNLNTNCNTSWSNEQSERFVMAVIGWSTMMFSYDTSTAHQHHITIQLDEPKQLSMNRMITSNRTAGSLICSLGLLDELSDDDISQDRLLYLGTLNYWSLKNIGNLHIVWVPHASQHLKLDVTTRTLYLFQYPTRSALHCLGGTMDQLFERFVISE